ncbi:DUF2231 domain-containing protein [Rhodococcus indonesiensis]|uniref:DUF2231 domain-containing protein n=1 Tax=Rhodococcus indonesiensis TaxID=3055869 RepID=UPI0039F701C7
MSQINGLPAHILLVHAIVVLVPLVAVGVVLSALWPAARIRLVWPIAVLATALLVLTPLTTEAGESLEDQVDRTALLHTHTELGDTMPFVAAALFVAVMLVVALHVSGSRRSMSAGRMRFLTVVTVLVAILVGVGATVQVYRVGDSGAQATWQDRVGVAAGEAE